MRNPAATLLLLAVPVLLSALFALVFTPGSGGTKIHFTMLVADADNTLVSRFIRGAFTHGELAEMVETVEVPPAEARSRFSQAEASALLEIPKGFGKRLLNGEKVELVLVKNPAQQVLPGVAEQIAASLATVTEYAARILGDPIRETGIVDESAKGFPSSDRFMSVSKGVYERLERVHRYISPPVISIKSQGPAKPTNQVNFYAVFFPGMALMALLFLAEATFRDFATEREGGQLRRLISAPIHPAQILVARLISAILLVFAGFIIQLAFAVVIFSMPVQSPLLLLGGGFLAAAACTGVMGMVHCLTGRSRSGEATASIAVVVLCMLGGSFIPLESLPAFFIHTARMTPNHWAISLLRHATGTASRITPSASSAILALALISISTGLIAAWGLSRQARKGVRP